MRSRSQSHQSHNWRNWTEIDWAYWSAWDKRSQQRWRSDMSNRTYVLHTTGKKRRRGGQSVEWYNHVYGKPRSKWWKNHDYKLGAGKTETNRILEWNLFVRASGQPVQRWMLRDVSDLTVGNLFGLCPLGIWVGLKWNHLCCLICDNVMAP